MDEDITYATTPPSCVDLDEGLDEYDKELAQTFPASDTPNSIHP